MLNLYLILGVISFSLPIVGMTRSAVAEVSQVRGKVSKLAPGELNARMVKLGDPLFEETSLVTQDKSFVQVVFNDQSKLSLGPNGKVVINQVRSKKPGVITLLKGKLRTKIEKNKDKNDLKNKFYVKTRSAAMGVRGTDFQTSYNPENKITSLLTYDGEVAMAKYDPDAPLESLKKTEIKREVVRRGGDVEVREVELKKSYTPESMEEYLEFTLDKKEAVVVKRGQYSGTVHSIGRTSLPVKISPVQYRALYENETLKEKFFKKDLILSGGEELLRDKTPIVQAAQSAPIEGLFNPKTGEYAPKAGGLIDFSTGIYVPPGESAEYHSKSGTFMPGREGKFDSETGQYIAPEGLVLDEKKGFIISDLKAEGKIRSGLLAMRGDLNKVIAQDIILSDPEKEKEKTYISARVLSNRERFTKNLISFTLRPYSESIKYTGDPLRSDFTLDGSGARALNVDWEHNSTNRLQLVTGFTTKAIDYKEDADLVANNLEFPSDNLFSFYGGLKYYLGTRWNLKSKVHFDQGHYVNFRTVSDVITPQLSRITLTKFHFGAELEAIRSASGKYSLDVGLEGVTNMLKNHGNLKVSRGFGYNADVSFKYWMEVYWWLKAGFYTESMSHDLEGEGYTASHNISATGVLLSSGYAF